MKKYLFLVIFLFVIGCTALFREGTIQPVTQFPQPSSKVSLALNLDYTMTSNGLRVFLLTQEKNIKKKLIERYEQSALFSDLKTTSDEADYILDVQWDDRFKQNFFLQIISYFAFCVPTSAKKIDIVKAKLTNNKTKETAEVTFQDSIRKWAGILFLPFNLFLRPEAFVPDGCLERLSDAFS